MPRFSLVVATLTRTDEFIRLLGSLEEQTFRDFEIIVVDQNPDTRLVHVIEDWSGKQAGGRRVPLQHIRAEPGLSRARNIGLRHCAGEILAFPDDDCWYLPDTLRDVHRWFQGNPGYGILSLPSNDDQGRTSGNRWPRIECDLNRINIFRTSATYGYFIRRPEAHIPVRFDESIGPGAGTPFGAGEDTDLLLGLMEHGIRGRFYSLLHVGHPVKGFDDVSRAEQYGGGFGRVLAKHSLRMLFCGLVAFDLVRSGMHLMLGHRARAVQLWTHARGMIRAYSGRVNR